MYPQTTTVFSNHRHFLLSPRRPGGEGRVSGADPPSRGAPHLTLPPPRIKSVGRRLTRGGSRPLLPEGRRGAHGLGLRC
jgi:hypothetical protein